MPAAKNSTNLNKKKTILISVYTVAEITLMVVHLKGEVWHAISLVTDPAQQSILALNTGFSPEEQFAE